MPGEFHGQDSLAGCSSWGLKESDTTECLAHTHTHFSNSVIGTKKISENWDCVCYPKDILRDQNIPLFLLRLLYSVSVSVRNRAFNSSLEQDQHIIPEIFYNKCQTIIFDCICGDEPWKQLLKFLELFEFKEKYGNHPPYPPEKKSFN